jgi:UDP-glucose 4-epimerase
MIAVTGATGFVGRRLVAVCRERGLAVRCLVRTVPPSSARNAAVSIQGVQETAVVGDLGAGPLDATHLAGCGTLIHAAARAHRMGERDGAAYHRDNVLATTHLLAAARSAGVRRVVLVSSIKAGRDGEDDYGRSKAEAERLVREAEGLDGVVMRPPLVHGPGAKGNLLRLMSAIAAGRLLPLGGVVNRRSLVGLDNLCDALITAATMAAEHLAADPAGRIYHVADAGVISTRRLVEVLAEGMGAKPRLVSVPRWLAVGGATLLGKGAVARRLFDDLEVDASAFTRDTGWHPRKTLEDGLREMAADFVRCQGKGV